MPGIQYLKTLCNNVCPYVSMNHCGAEINRA